MNAHALSAEVDRNYDYFQRKLACFLPDNFGRYALIRHRHLIGFFDDPGAAAREGATHYPDGLYSIQEVTDEPTDLGLYSNADD